MDGKGGWRDNVFVERFWRSLKYEEVYLRAYASVAEAKHFIGRLHHVLQPATTAPRARRQGAGKSILRSAEGKGGGLTSMVIT